MRMRYGRHLRMELFGSSHGPEVGVQLEGLPAGTLIDLAGVQAMLERRRPGTRALASRRQEEDRLVVDEGVVDGKSHGPTVRAHVANTDVRRGDYARFRKTPRPGHADYPARIRFGDAADLSGGGIFSGRMTVGLVIAGAIAAQWLARIGIEISSFTRAIGAVQAEVPEGIQLSDLARRARSNEMECPDLEAAGAMAEVVARARKSGDSVGGIIETRATGLPVGLGEPFFDSVESVISHLALAVPAVKAIEFGAGFAAAGMLGSEHNDAFVYVGGVVRTRTNHSGGVLGGMATGMPLVFRVAVKPTRSIAREQETVDLTTGRPARIVVGGRHDPCIVPRAVVVLESITAIGLAELALEGGFLAGPP
jgi:chorismate synthase